MNLEYFQDSVDILSYTGRTLNAEKSLLINNSLVILQNESKLRNIYFWGQILGIEKDYYIAFELSNERVQRKYFFSLNCIDWQLLDQPNSDLQDISVLCVEKFTGDPSYLFKVKYDNKNEEINLKELNRLSCVVHTITEESAIIPRGGLYKTTQKTIILNPMFHGLDSIQSLDLSNYQLFREPKNKFNTNLLKRHDYNYAIDFLDTLDDIIPDEFAFTLSTMENGKIVLIKSLIWIGMVFFHKVQSHNHGFCYIGDGRKNPNLLFMV